MAPRPDQRAVWRGQVPVEPQGCVGIGVGETTDDDMFTLIEIECIGACGGAPSMLVDETLYENVTADQIPQIVAKAKQSGH